MGRSDLGAGVKFRGEDGGFAVPPAEFALHGSEFGFHGVNHDVTAPERLISTFEFEGLPESGHVILETTKFEELPGGRTRVTTQSVYQSVEDRDGMIASGMESGVVDGHERLDEILETLKKS